MGRRIPGKKHRGVKDPLEQQAKRNERLKKIINAPPIDPDDQEIPKSVIELNRLRQLVKDGKLKKHKKKKKVCKNLINTSNFFNPGPKLPGMTQRDKMLPKLQQMVGESEAHFLNRVNSAAEDLIKEAKIERKYNVTINRNSDGSVEEINCNEINDKISKPSNMGKKKNSKNTTNALISEEKPVKLSRKKRLKLKKREKKNEAVESAFEFKTDHVKFGEVAHAPPTLRFKPKGLCDQEFDKPGHRNLLLKAIINRSK
uniref:Putative coiled-coil domain-containing protein 137-like isoform 2 n=1 Tax=Rhodnius neglectus TaxID=72488 RepID=A0A0P4VMC2_9HEMI